MNLARMVSGHEGEQVALWSRGRPTSYAALERQVEGLRGGLVGLGIAPGDRVALLCSNDRFFVVSYFAVLGIGAVAVPLNPTSPPVALQRELASVGATAIVVEASSRSVWEGVDRTAVPSLHHVIAAEFELVGATNLEALMSCAPAALVDRGPSDLAALMFTSGTAGMPRAAMLTHGNLVSNIEQSRAQDGGITAADVVYGVLPLHHIFGLNVVLGMTMTVGATVVLVQRFDPATALETIRERQVTVIAGAPPMWTAWSGFTEADPASFAGVRLALTGAAKMSEEHARAFQARFGLELREGYGLTEASPVVTTSVGIKARIGSIGVALPGVELRLVDTDSQDALVGDAGELWVRGPNVFTGYWDDVDATARALTSDGWLRTGDIAVVDDEGYISIVDRAKDLIIVSGFNVYPAEVEEAIGEHAAVAEVSVVGVPHPYTGEAVKAFVVLASGTSVGEEAIIGFCSDRLARYKCPSKVLFVAELPKGLGGKVLRRALQTGD